MFPSYSHHLHMIIPSSSHHIPIIFLSSSPDNPIIFSSHSHNFPIIFPSSSHHISIIYSHVFPASSHLPGLCRSSHPFGPFLVLQADIEALLEALGIPFVHAPAEAEAQCAFLAEAVGATGHGPWAMASWCRFFGTYELHN